MEVKEVKTEYQRQAVISSEFGPARTPIIIIIILGCKGRGAYETMKSEILKESESSSFSIKKIICCFSVLLFERGPLKVSFFGSNAAGRFGGAFFCFLQHRLRQAEHCSHSHRSTSVSGES